jgi:poly-gamma-glutamate synthesis protein (capsule biosynthesis protein)
VITEGLSLSVTAVGDIMLGDSAICVGFGFNSLYPGERAREAFAGINDLLCRSDVVFGNLECSLAATNRKLTRWRRDQMRGAIECAPMLREIGFTALSVANNHSVQHGIGAFEETVMRLRTARILCVGVRGTTPWTCEPAVQNLPDGRRIGMLGYCLRPQQYGRGKPPFAEGTLEEVVADIRRLSGSVEAVLVSLHWGEEFVRTPSVSELEAGRSLIEAGALAVFGHHPHVLRPCERVGEGIVAYSLGNIVSDMVWQDALRLGGILACEWENGRLQSATLTETQLDLTYRAVAGIPSRIGDGFVSSLEKEAYFREAKRALRAQQIAAYQYAVKRLLRYPPGVLGELAKTTVRNKIDDLLERFLGRS